MDGHEFLLGLYILVFLRFFFFWFCLGINVGGKIVYELDCATYMGAEKDEYIGVYNTTASKRSA